MTCDHDFINQENLVADGYCISCLLKRIENLEKELGIYIKKKEEKVDDSNDTPIYFESGKADSAYWWLDSRYPSGIIFRSKSYTSVYDAWKQIVLENNGEIPKIYDVYADQLITELNRCKFAQHKDLHKMLVDTYPHALIPYKSAVYPDKALGEVITGIRQEYVNRRN